MRAIILGMLLGGCVAYEPPRPDEALCGWQRVEFWEAPADQCARVVGAPRLRPGSDACVAKDADPCVVLQPGASVWFYTDSTSDYDATVTVGDCSALACP